jgi:hypothetical protein
MQHIRKSKVTKLNAKGKIMADTKNGGESCNCTTTIVSILLTPAIST